MEETWQDRRLNSASSFQQPCYSFRYISRSSLAPPIHPTSSAVDEGNHGTLSDYSDYSSSDGEDYPSHRGAPPTSASASFPSASTSGGGLEESASDARSYARYIQEDKADGSKGLLEEEEDPFADPSTPGIADSRMNWREV